jgi:hypothetical protein
MKHGSYFVEFEILKIPGLLILGLGRPGLHTGVSAYNSAEFWGVSGNNGAFLHAGGSVRWAGQEGFCACDVIGLHLDCERGRLAIVKNGRQLGVPVAAGLCGELCWAVVMGKEGASVKMRRPKGGAPACV